MHKIIGVFHTCKPPRLLLSTLKSMARLHAEDQSSNWHPTPNAHPAAYASTQPPDTAPSFLIYHILHFDQVDRNLRLAHLIWKRQKLARRKISPAFIPGNQFHTNVDDGHQDGRLADRPGMGFREFQQMPANACGL